MPDGSIRYMLSLCFAVDIQPFLLGDTTAPNGDGLSIRDLKVATTTPTSDYRRVNFRAMREDYQAADSDRNVDGSAEPIDHSNHIVTLVGLMAGVLTILVVLFATDIRMTYLLLAVVLTAVVWNTHLLLTQRTSNLKPLLFFVCLAFAVLVFDVRDLSDQIADLSADLSEAKSTAASLREAKDELGRGDPEDGSSYHEESTQPDDGSASSNKVENYESSTTESNERSDPRAVEEDSVYKSGYAHMEEDDWFNLEDWAPSDSDNSDVTIQDSVDPEFIGWGGAVLKVVANASRSSCREIREWDTSLRLGSLESGDNLCFRTQSGRYGMLTITGVTSWSLSFEGVTWK